jgi:polyphosphate kinase 2 (PPK2 family)
MLADVDLEKKLERAEYKAQLLEYQVRLRDLALRCYRERQSVVLVFEGWDASGKGGSIRRLTEKLDPRSSHVYAIAAPRGEDKDHHYLWRFWRRLLPADEKQIVIFDRSWYGRVLVERVEGFASRKEWKRAYAEINDFERQMVEGGFLLVKYWFHVDANEQLRRFEARRATPHKTWKLTEEDYRNRANWDDYETAVEEMLVKTSTGIAPWTVVAGNDRRYARVKCIRTLVDALQSKLDGALAPPDCEES